MTRSVVPACTLIMLLGSSGLALAQGMPLGPEFRVNTNTAFAQIGHSVASDVAGNFVVVWESWSQQGGGYQIDTFGQRYDSGGVPLGGEFRINTYTTGNQFAASVAAGSAGNFVVTWSGRLSPPATHEHNVFARRYASTGVPLGGEFRVNTYTTRNQFGSSLASDAAGNFVIVWMSDSQDGDGFGIFGQRYDGAGSALGGEFRVNTYTTSAQRLPAVASDPAGNFVVVWQSLGQDGSSYGIFGQRYAATGSPLGAEFRVNSVTASEQRDPAVAADSANHFVVTWESTDFSGLGVFAQRYADTGAPLGGEFRVNTYTTSDQDDPSVTSDSDGNFVVAWQSWVFDGITLGEIFAQRYASSGVPLGGAFRVNTYTTNNQIYPSLASDVPGHFVIAWTSCWTQDGSGCGVYAQRYSMIVPVELLGFRVE
jgi:hypothetical protein